MVEEAASSSKTSVAEVMQTLEPNQASIEATVASALQGGTESINNNDAKIAATDVSDEEREKTLEFAEELTEIGSAFLKDKDFAKAVDCFSRSLEIRVKHYDELGTECVNAYYRYGLALFQKAQAEADPLGNVAKKEGDVQQESSNKDVSAKNKANGASDGSSSSGQEDQGEDGEYCPDDDLNDADVGEEEDDSDLDMAWKMLDIARVITDKHSIDTIEKADILCALAEISLEREDFESALNDYKKALSILERLDESDSRNTAELNFYICICLETGGQPKEAIPYCQKAMLICKARMDRLTDEIKGASGSANYSTVSEIDKGIQQSSNVPDIDTSASDKEAEIGVLSGLVEDLENKLEDLEQQAENPKKNLAELMGIASAKTNASDKVVHATDEMSSSSMGTANTSFGKDLESPTVSTFHTGAAASAGGGASSGVTHLGVVGRGVKRILTNITSVESSASKLPATEFSDKADGNSS